MTEPIKLPPLPEPDSYLFQHEETGLSEYVDSQQVEWGFEKANPRWQKIHGAFTERQLESYARAAIEADRQARVTPADLDLATEIWAAAQTVPGEGIEDAEDRIAQILANNRQAMGEPVTCFKCGHAKHGGECVNVAPQPQQQATHSRQDSHDDDPSGADGYAYRYRNTNGSTVLRFNHGEEVNGSRPIEAVPFWFAPQPPQIPEGYKLVPVEPTEEMVKAANQGDRLYTDRCFGKDMSTVMQGPYDHYKAMLEAAPEPKDQK